MKRIQLLKENLTLVVGCLVVGLVLAIGLRAGQKASPSVRSPSDDAPTSKPTPKPKPAPAAKGLLVDLGNELCPALEAAVDGSTYIEWKQLRIGFCCPGCDQKFLKDPEAALDKTTPKWRDALAAIQVYDDAEPKHRAHMLAKLKEKWTVVRNPEGK